MEIMKRSARVAVEASSSLVYCSQDPRLTPELIRRNKIIKLR